MQKQTLNRIGLAALILLAPGGFVLGATLATRHYRDRARKKAEEAEAGAPQAEEAQD